jgi:hypothetical protein
MAELKRGGSFLSFIAFGNQSQSESSTKGYTRINTNAETVAANMVETVNTELPAKPAAAPVEKTPKEKFIEKFGHLIIPSDHKTIVAGKHRILHGEYKLELYVDTSEYCMMQAYESFIAMELVPKSFPLRSRVILGFSVDAADHFTQGIIDRIYTLGVHVRFNGFIMPTRRVGTTKSEERVMHLVYSTEKLVSDKYIQLESLVRDAILSYNVPANIYHRSRATGLLMRKTTIMYSAVHNTAHSDVIWMLSAD